MKTPRLRVTNHQTNPDNGSAMTQDTPTTDIEFTFDEAIWPSQQLEQTDFIYDNDLLEKFIAQHGIHVSDAVSYGSILSDFLKNLRPGLDITRISLPSFLLKPFSYLESAAENSTPDTDLLLRTLGTGKTAYAGLESKTEQGNMDPPFVPLHTPSTPELRMLTITRWMLVMLASTPQFGFRGIKPYNPILGERFMCHWDHDDGSVTNFVSEQVSHHPPISAIYYENREHGITLEGAMKVKATFGIKNADTQLLGYRMLRLLKYDEDYDFQLPGIQGKINFFFGKNAVEYCDDLVVRCEKTGYKTTIESKKRNEIKGKIVDGKGRTVYKIHGNAIGEIIFDADTKNSVVKQNVVIPNAKDLFLQVINRAKRKAQSVHLQHEKEARRVWHDLTYALKIGDMEMATKHKMRIEDEQRKVRKERVSDTYESEYFVEDETSTNKRPVWIYKNRLTRDQYLAEQEMETTTSSMAQATVTVDEVQESVTKQ